ncbi:uncharacterized protein LOC123291683 [Chrysoperla carnea]|uniref:uncharacterized protein LOC123291683 n=1 Tax=Chrysoperla carnea TaxID=189513 RepID=UPI001D097722|nr:uncharacterized protein LOC123291683 [Chrysoperla carnea]
MNVSDKIDKKLAEVRELITSNGFDPLTLPDIEKEFEARPVLFKHNGKIKLTKGWMKQLANIKRSGDAILIPRLGTKQLIKCTIELVQVDFNYKYKLKMGLLYKRSGKIKGNMKHFKVYFEFYYDIVRKYVQIKKINIIDDGEITVKLTGHIITDGLFNKKVREIAEQLHQQIVDVIQQKINDSIDLINEKLKPKRGQLSQQEIDFQREIEKAYFSSFNTLYNSTDDAVNNQFNSSIEMPLEANSEY